MKSIFCFRDYLKLAIIFAAIFLTGCKSAFNPKYEFLEWVKKGKVISSVMCKEDQSVTYSLYLPSNYDVKKSWPVIFCFDPKGDGTLPVSRFQNIAETMGYIVVGSNNSRNGMQFEEIDRISGIMFRDVEEKMAINKKRIYLAGFSGGARIACLLAFRSNEIKGVIACSACFDNSVTHQSNFDFIGISGSEDMNYVEMRQLEKSMVNWGSNYQFITYEGKHQWPPIETLSRALQIMELYAMKSGVIEKNMKMVNSLYSEDTAKLAYYTKSDDLDTLSLALRFTQNCLEAYSGLADTSFFKNEIDNLNKNKKLTAYLKKEEAVEQAESKKENDYSSTFSVKTLEWWKKELTNLNNTVEKGTTLISRNSAKRLLSFISIMSYSYVNAALSRQNWKAAGYFLSIYKMADPDNPDYYYFLSCYYSNTGQFRKAVESLRTAMSKGFSDRYKLINDPLLDKVRALPEFATMIQ
jgi:hypothetical protein